MTADVLDLLRCPFCGTGLRPVPGTPAAPGVAILGCACCAYPVVAGIPYLRTGPTAEAALRLIGTGQADEALVTLLSPDKSRREAVRGLVAGGAVTFRDALAVLSPSAEGDYLLYRFSDPTYLCARAVLRAVGRDRRCFARPALDACAGAGHLTRVLCGLAAEAGVVAADIAFWKLWLAKRFVAPDCRPVCCDANQPLPFARGAFALAVCSDAFHYVWARRLFAGELARAAGDDGTVLLTHLHNRLCENASAGMPLAPAEYRDLFDGGDARLFPERAVLDGLLEGRPPDLSARHPDEALDREPALNLLATQLAGLGGTPESEDVAVAEPLAVNPLYAREHDADGPCLRLRFPSPEYEAEYATCKQYLPNRVPWGDGLAAQLRAGERNGEVRRLADRGVLLHLPDGYC